MQESNTHALFLSCSMCARVCVCVCVCVCEREGQSVCRSSVEHASVIAVAVAFLAVAFLPVTSVWLSPQRQWSRVVVNTVCPATAASVRSRAGIDTAAEALPGRTSVSWQMTRTLILCVCVCGVCICICMCVAPYVAGQTLVFVSRAPWGGVLPFSLHCPSGPTWL